MALRVLLADESTTIKKVFQLALQDFAVEVRPVNLGVDVLPVAKSFKPDIIFADVLLQKKNGYDVCSELKADAEMNATPVVLMWSGFMELDEDKFQASQANARLEKPFDVTALRKLITSLVPKTQNHRISQFLKFPKMPEMEEPKAVAEAPAPEAAAEEAADTGAVGADPGEEFQQVSISKMKGAERFRLNIDASNEDPEIPVSVDADFDPVDVDSLMKSEEPEEFEMRETKLSSEPPPMPSMTNRPSNVALPSLSQDDLLTLAKAEIQDQLKTQLPGIVESIVWKVIPDLAQQIIERELQRLLKEKDASTY